MGRQAETTEAGLPQHLRFYIAAVIAAGIGWTGLMIHNTNWELSQIGQLAFFTVLMVGAGSFPLAIAPRIKADVATAAMFCAAIVATPGVAVSAAIVGIVLYTSILRFRKDKILLPWYKYTFNAGQIALTMGLTSLVFHQLAGGDVVNFGIIVAAGTYYVVNTLLVSFAAGLQMNTSPLAIWWSGTREMGLMEVSQLALGFLGAMVLKESLWAVVALFVPVAVVYGAFSRSKLVREELEAKVDELEVHKTELSLATGQLSESRRRIVDAQEEACKQVAQRLHGPVQNRLLVATRWLRNTQNSIATVDPETSRQIEKAVRLIEEINEKEVRGAVRELHPPLIRVSLLSSLRSLADEFLKDLDVRFEIDQRDIATKELWKTGLPEGVRISMYRVAEEAMNNILKYADATQVSIILDLPTSLVATITIRDNGRGFDRSNTPPGYGILSMQDHCGSKGGRLEVESRVGDGTSVVATFPVGLTNGQLHLGHNSTEKFDAYELVENGNGRIDEIQPLGPTVKPPITVLIVDDQPDFCALVREMLKPYPELQVVAEGYDGPTALNLVEAVNPVAVLLDVEIPDFHGLDIAEEIRMRFPRVKVVLMSAYHQKEYIEGDERAQGANFIPKVEFSIQALIQACQKDLPEWSLSPAGR